VDATTGTGLSNLMDRADALGGTFELEAGPDGAGSRAAWRAPLPR
jgi:signal transduction histidine kinase